MPRTNNESMLPRESTSVKQMIAFVGEGSLGHKPDVNDEFIFYSLFDTDDIIMEQEDTNEAGMC